MELTQKEKDLISSVLQAPSLYPELERKDEQTRLKELLSWKDKYNDINIYYNDYGFDVIGLIKNQDAYLDYGSFKEDRYHMNSKYIPEGSAFPYDYTLIFRDKRLFDSYFRQISPKEVVKTHAYVIEGKLRVLGIESGKEVSPEEFAEMHIGEKFAFKRNFGQNGSCLQAVHFLGNGMVEVDCKKWLFRDFLLSIGNRYTSWVVQDWINQHSFYANLNKTSINTMRVVTFHTGKDVIVSAKSLIVGIEGNVVNNVARHLKDYSIGDDGKFGEVVYNLEKYTKEKSEIANIQVPFYNEVEALVTRFHKAIPEVFTVGWDVAFTPDGPIIVEGNDGWHPVNVQRSAKPMREIWTSLVKERMEYCYNN